MCSSLLFGTALAVAFILSAGHLVGGVPQAVGSGLDSPAGRSVLSWLAVVAVIFVVQQLHSPLRNIAVGTMSRRVDGTLRQRVMRATFAPTGVGHLEDPKLLDKIRDAQGIGSGQWTPGGAIEGLVQNSAARLQTISSAILVARFRWWLAIVLLVFGVVVRQRLMDDSMRGASWGQTQTPKLRRSDYMRELALTPEAAKETRVFGLGGWVLGRFSSYWNDAMQEIWTYRKKTEAGAWTWSFPWGVLVGGSFLLAGRAATTGEIDVGELAVVAQSVLGASSIWLSNADVGVAYGAAAVPAMIELEELMSDPARVFKGHADPSSSPRDEIRFEHLAFRYPGRDVDVFNDLTLDIPAGNSIAIVGRNGAGKTTLVKLLARLYEPTAGRITVDGVDLADLDPKLWQRRIGAIFQDYVRYEMNVRRNVAYGAFELADDQDALDGAARDSGALELIDELPESWDTVLSREYTKGSELSGGQWQRIALARALFAVRAGAGLLVLDEPTANLDVRAEAEIFDRFLELTHGLTTILISHRFSTVRHADRICVLEDGRIIEQGSHDELLALRGRYSEMFLLQAARFRDDDVEPADV